jgi:hypothetical protein
MQKMPIQPKIHIDAVEERTLLWGAKHRRNGLSQKALSKQQGELVL